MRFRLAWRWKGSGISGSTPWVQRSDVVEGWLESFTRRSGERVEHWIEVNGPRTSDRGAPERSDQPGRETLR